MMNRKNFFRKSQVFQDIIGFRTSKETVASAFTSLLSKNYIQGVNDEVSLYLSGIYKTSQVLIELNT